MNDKNTSDLSIETSINYLSSKDSNGLSNIFALSGSSSSTSVQFSLSERKAAFINEIGVFVVSDDKDCGDRPNPVGVKARDAINRRLYKGLIIVKMPILLCLCDL